MSLRLELFAPNVRRRAYLAGVTVLFTAACRGADESPRAIKAIATAADSRYLPSVMIVKFRERVPEHPTTFGDGATTSIHALLAQYVRGVERADTAVLRPLALTVSEFAWLYYLDSPMAHAPYELDPDVMWMQISSQSQKGLVRALNVYGGKPLGTWTSACDAPKSTGALRMHECAVTLRGPSGAPAKLKISLIERAGRYKLVGFGTNL